MIEGGGTVLFLFHFLRIVFIIDVIVAVDEIAYLMGGVM